MMPQNFNNQLLVTVITFTESESSFVMNDRWNNQFLDIKTLKSDKTSWWDWTWHCVDLADIAVYGC